MEELLSRCSSLGFTAHTCRYAIPYNFVDELIFVFVVVNEAFHLRLYLTSSFFLKNETEDLERPCRIFTLQLSTYPVKPHQELMILIQAKSPSQRIHSPYAEAFVSSIIMQKDQTFKLDFEN